MRASVVSVDSPPERIAEDIASYAALGVQELETPDQDMDEEATQQAPPDWVAEDVVELDDVTLERRLRASFRRLRSHLDESAAAAEAITSFLREPDVGMVRLR